MTCKSFSDVKKTPAMLAESVSGQLLGNAIDQLTHGLAPARVRSQLLRKIDSCGKGKGLVRNHPLAKTAMWLATVD